MPMEQEVEQTGPSRSTTPSEWASVNNEEMERIGKVQAELESELQTNRRRGEYQHRLKDATIVNTYELDNEYVFVLFLPTGEHGTIRFEKAENTNSPLYDFLEIVGDTDSKTENALYRDVPVSYHSQTGWFVVVDDSGAERPWYLAEGKRTKHLLRQGAEDDGPHPHLSYHIHGLIALVGIVSMILLTQSMTGVILGIPASMILWLISAVPLELALKNHPPMHTVKIVDASGTDREHSVAKQVFESVDDGS